MCNSPENVVHSEVSHYEAVRREGELVGLLSVLRKTWAEDSMNPGGGVKIHFTTWVKRRLKTGKEDNKNIIG